MATGKKASTSIEMSLGRPNEIYEQNIDLRRQNEQLKAGKCEPVAKSEKSKGKRCLVAAIVMIILVILGFLAYQLYITSTLISTMASNNRSPGLGKDESKSLLKSYYNVAWRNDETIQECNGPFMKKTFPDVDYAFLGYNILKGYPLAIGHDPGFTHPIFKVDYSALHQTADCRYSVPHGFTIIPDVSCVTSFSSDEVKTSFEFSESLSAQASVSAGGWGVSFSASAGYKEASSTVSTGQTIYILSSAFCNYYYAILNSADMPHFDETFLRWAKKLAEDDVQNDEVIRFIDYYGTHFLTEVKFGAKFIYQHKMTSKSYSQLSSSEFSVSVQASYSGAFSLGGGFGLESSQQQAASSFSQKVETKTITVGAAPPSNGDAMTWASTVKDTPVPTKYSLESIDKLFTPQFMDTSLDIDFEAKKVQGKLNRVIFEGKYCAYLLTKGTVDSCKDFSTGWVSINDILLWASLSISERETKENTCIEQCLKDKYCIAIVYCDRSVSNNTCSRRPLNCYFYSSKKGGQLSAFGLEKLGWKLTIFTSKMKTTNRKFLLRHVMIESTRSRETSNATDTLKDCEALCERDPNCNAFNYCSRTQKWCEDMIDNCNTYMLAADDKITLKYKEMGHLKFVPKKSYDIEFPETTSTLDSL